MPEQIQSPSDGITKTTHAMVLCLILTCVAFFMWSFIGKLDVVSIAPGEVKPFGQVKSIQHLEGGIIREIHVKVGDRVEKDQALIVLEPVISESIVKQREKEIAETQARLKNARKSLKFLNEQVSISEELLEEELTNRYNHLELLREASSMQSRIDEDKASIERVRAALSEAQERLSRTILRAPVHGVVKQLHVHTIGGVVQPGEVIVDLVPSDDRLIIEAQLSVQDIGHIQQNQDARIRLASSDASRFGALDGTVIYISPDSIVDENNHVYYEVHIETTAAFFEHGKNRYQLLPGVQVIASIRTGKRSVFSYLFAPFLSGMDTALQER